MSERIGPYEVLQELGRGGMGAVYRGLDPETGREVAIKVLTNAQNATPQQHQRFVREAQVVAALKHPGIVGVHDVAIFAGVPCIVYELVAGGRTLDDVFPSLTLAERLELVLELADALAHVHDQGLIHRDIKPSNVLVDERGRARLTDFGLVGGIGLERLTLTGRQMGTPAYMAPEQMTAQREAVGPHSDVWALGVILYQALTGSVPFQADTPLELLVRVGESPATPPSDLAKELIPAGAEAVCLRAIAKAPQARYPDARAFHQALSSVLDGTYRRPLRRGWIAFGGAALLLAGLALSAQGMLHAPPEVPPLASYSPAPSVTKTEGLLTDQAKATWSRALEDLTRELSVSPRNSRKLYARGALLQEMGDLESAVSDLEACLREDPDHAPAYYRLLVARWTLGGAKAWTNPPDLQREVQTPFGFFYRGNARYLADELPGAQADFTEVIKSLPKFAPAYLNRGCVRAALGDLRGSLSDLDRAVSLGASAKAHLQRASVLLQLGRAQEALGDAESAVKKDPQNVDALVARAWARRGVGDQKGSEADVRRAQILAPDSLDVLFEIAQQLEARGDPAGAIAIYKRMLTIDPEDPGALNNLAARYLETGRHEGVEVLLRKILAKQPHDSMALANLSSLYLHKGRLQEAYELALSAVDQSPSAYQEREQFARVLIGLGKHDEALAQLERVLLNHPKRARAHYLRSMALFHKEQWDSAIAALSEAIGIAPTFPEYLKQRALQYQKQKRYSEALHDLDRLLKLTPTAEIYTVRGWTRAEAGDLAGALSDHGNALRIDPQAEQARLNRSKLLQDAGRPREAIEDLEQLVEQSPQRAIYRYHLAALRLALKDFPGSRADSQRYRLLAPRDPSGCVLEGRARAGLREFREAVACYDSALELNAKHVMALAYKAEALRELKEWAHVVETIDRLLPLLHASKSEPIRDARQDALNRLKKAKRAPPR